MPHLPVGARDPTIPHVCAASNATSQSGAAAHRLLRCAVMPSAFPSPAELFSASPRERAWRRAVDMPLVRFFAGLLAMTPAAAAELHEIGRHAGTVRVGRALLVTLALLLTVHLYARGVEARKAVEVSLRSAIAEGLAGVGAGAALFAATAFVLVLTGDLAVSYAGTPHALAAGFTRHLPHALLEEMIFRWLLFKLTEEALGSRVALVTTAAFFGAAHAGSPGATAVGVVAVGVEAGLLLAAGFICTRRLWLPWGIHFGWNFAEAAVFGERMSGQVPEPGVLVTRAIGRAWMTGGTFGVEASPVAVALCASLAVGLLAHAARRGRLVTYAAARTARAGGSRCSGCPGS